MGYGCLWLLWYIDISHLVGGLEHEFYFPHIGNNHPNWRAYFSEGLKHVETTIQYIYRAYIPTYGGFQSSCFAIYFSTATSPTRLSITSPSANRLAKGSERLGDPSHASARDADPWCLVFGQGAESKASKFWKERHFWSATGSQARVIPVISMVISIYIYK